MSLTFKNIGIFIMLLGTAIVLTGCGGSSGGGSSTTTYSGVTSAATIDDSSAETLGTTATEAMSEAITNDSANDGNPFAFAASVTNSANSTSLSSIVTEIARKAASQMVPLNLPVGLTLTSAELGPGFCGGSISIPDNFAGATEATLLNGSIVFNNLCFDGGADGQITMNGKITFTETAALLTISYVNFTVVFNGQTQTINATISCSTGSFSCTFSSDYVGADGKVYRVSDFVVGGNATGGYTISATFFHPDLGSVTVQTTTSITFSSNGNPNGGVLLLTSGSATATITFNADGLTYSGNWSDTGAGTSGTFTGTW